MSTETDVAASALALRVVRFSRAQLQASIARTTQQPLAVSNQPAESCGDFIAHGTGVVFNLDELAASSLSVARPYIATRATRSAIHCR